MQNKKLSLLIFAAILFLTLLIIKNNIRNAFSSQQQNNEYRWSQFTLPALGPDEKFKLALQAKIQRKKYLEESNNKIQEFSKRLDDYIRLWLDKKADGKFPKGFFSEWIENEKTNNWQLISPDQINGEEQWYAMTQYDPALVLRQLSPDPHVTYLKLIFLAPLGSKLHIEGDFPHARFMDYQILIPVDPEFPVTGRDGVCEVPIVDVDIEPDPGNVNPFRKGADRNAEKRHYNITFDLKAGNALKLNPKAMVEPYYRAEGNTRTGGPFAFAGPYGGNVIVPSIIWLRYYAPDKDAGPYGGVPFPKATLELPTGEKYWITCDKSLAVKLQTNPVPDNSVTPASLPHPIIGPSLGWLKMFDIMMSHAEAKGMLKSIPWGDKDPTETKKRIRNQFLLMFNRGLQAKPPGNYEVGPTCCNYISYLLRPIYLDDRKIIVLTGKLPEYPKTRNGEKTTNQADVRYFSITHQLGAKGDTENYLGGIPYGSLMDDEIIVNEKNEYVIVYSKEEDRPKNAKAEYGVTFQQWGAPSLQTFVLRWLSVYPDHYISEFVPNVTNIPWAKGSWLQDDYDENLVGKNKPGALGPYHPIIHYLTKAEFEALGPNISASKIPEWIEPKESEYKKEIPSRLNNTDIQQKINELKQSFQLLAKARQNKNYTAIRFQIKAIKKTWGALPPEVQKAIEDKWPGIREKIENAGR